MDMYIAGPICVGLGAGFFLMGLITGEKIGCLALLFLGFGLVWMLAAAAFGVISFWLVVLHLLAAITIGAVVGFFLTLFAA